MIRVYDVVLQSFSMTVSSKVLIIVIANLGLPNIIKHNNYVHNLELNLSPEKGRIVY